MNIISKTYYRLVFWFDSLLSKDDASKRMRENILAALSEGRKNELTHSEENKLYYMESAFQRWLLIFLQSLLFLVVLYGVISR